METRQKFDPTANVNEYVVMVRQRSSVVLGPADTTEGACFGRREICETKGLDHKETAEFIASLLNVYYGPGEGD